MINKVLGERLKLCRNDLNLSQGEMADVMGIDQGRLSKIEACKIHLSSTLAHRLATKLSINPNYLLSLEPNMYLNKTSVNAVNEPSAEYNTQKIKNSELVMELRETILDLKTEILELKTKLLNSKSTD